MKRTKIVCELLGCWKLDTCGLSLKLAATILLTVSYPPSYPDTAPDLALSASPSAPKTPHLAFPDDGLQLLADLEELIQDSLGLAMIFTLINALKDNTEALISTRLDDEQAKQDKERAKAEEAENAKFHGEVVTRESFLAWRSKFREEMEREAEERRKAEEEGKSKKALMKGEEVKMTGKDLWEKGLVGKVEEDDEDVDALSGVESLRVAD